MPHFTSLVLSNQLDLLAGILARTLEEEGDDPFAPRIILTASKEMKSWLLAQIVRFSSKKAVAGLKIFSWQEGIRYLLNQPGKEPSSLELYMLLYEALCASEEPLVQEYVRQSKVVDLAYELTDLFMMYGYYDLQASAEDWQMKLWRQIFEDGPWKTALQLLESPLTTPASVYCFGCNHLPPAVWQALLRLPEMTIFQFSPCMMYWEDLCSNRELRALMRTGEKKGVSKGELDQLQAYLSDAHPLLANWGKLGRSTLKILHSSDVQPEEVYEERKETFTDLAQLQKDFLFHTVSGEGRQDGSITIHKTGVSKLREVQVLRDEMLRAHAQGIAFSEMVVLAPRLEIYAPLIEWIFAEEPFSIPCQMIGIAPSAQESAWQGFQRLLSLSQSRWDAEDVLFVLEHAAFRAKRGWDIQRLDQIRRWVQEARIRWGYGIEQKERHLAEWLNSEASKARGTWDEGSDRFLSSMVYLLPDGELPFIPPLAGIGLSDADEVEELLQVVFELRKDLAALTDGSLHPLAEWRAILGALYETYFVKEGDDIFQEILHSFDQAGEKINTKVPFAALLPWFQRKQKKSVGTSLLHAARLSSLEEGAVFPCRALFLIGMDEESFPRRSFSSSLNRCKTAPPRSEIDRYLFLQAVSSAQDLVRISYGHISAEDGKEINPSLVIQEWLHCTKLPVVTHPSFPWDRRCFEEPQCRIMSIKEEKAARIFYGEKKPLQCLSFTRPSNPEPSPSPILLKDLKSVFSQPWKYFLQKTAGIWLQEEAAKDWTDFEMPAFQRASTLQAGLFQPLEKLVDILEKKGHFPVGLFGEIAEKNLSSVNEEWKEHLASWNLRPEEVFACKCPPFVGEVPHCTPRGPIHFGDDSFAALLRNWPLYLTALSTLGAREIFCVRSGKIKVVEDPVEALKGCLELYHLAAKAPLPLVSAWADPLIRKRDPEALERVLHGESRSFGWEDPVCNWVLARTGQISAQELVDEWRDYLHARLFSLVEIYSPKKQKAHEKI